MKLKLSAMKLKLSASVLTLALAGMVGAAGDASACATLVAANVGVDTTWGGGANPSPVCLAQPIFVVGDATLTILPGTIVRGMPRSGPVVVGSTVGTPGALIVTRNGQIIADASAASPIVMTTAAVDNDADGTADDLDGDGFKDGWPGFDPADCPGACALAGLGIFLDNAPTVTPLAPLGKDGFATVSLWGGLVIEGNAPTNLADQVGVGYGTSTIEGLTIPGFPVADATFGGVDPHDNSGILRYVSVRHAGDEIGQGNELNGVSLGGVGDGTIIDFVEVYVNFDDGFEFFGGTVNPTHLVVAFAGDDTFDADEGFTGTAQFLFGVMPFFNNEDGSAFGSGSGDRANEFDGDDLLMRGGDVNLRIPVTATSLLDIDVTGWPYPNASIWNMTIIGSTPDAGPDFAPVSAAATNRGVFWRSGYAGEMFNSIIVNTGGNAGLELDMGLGEGAVDVATHVANPNLRGALGRVAMLASTLDDGAAPAAGAAALAIANGDAKAAAYGGTANVVNSPLFPGLVNEDVTFPLTGDALGHLVAAKGGNPLADPRVGFGLVGVAGGVPPQGVGLDSSATYRGAFDPGAPVNWTTGWTALSQGGVLAP